MANSIYQQSYMAYVAETTPGTTPSTPSMLKLRTNDPLQASSNKEVFESEEVLSHRQREHVRHGRRGFQGSVPTDLSYEAYNDWLEALLSGSWNDGVLKAGTTLKTFTVEQRIASDIFIRGLGVAPSQLSITLTPDGLVSCNWDLIGMDFKQGATSLGSPADVATNAPFDGLGNAAITEGGSAIATVTSLEMTINAQKTVGALLGTNTGDVPTDGQLQITGNMTARFNSIDLFDKFDSETETSLSFTLTNPGADDTLAFELPRVKYTGGQPQNNDNVIDVACSFEGLYDSGESSSIVITETAGV